MPRVAGTTSILVRKASGSRSGAGSPGGRNGSTSALTPSVIAYGEWCYAEHSVFYDSLPDWFLLFDLYDRGEGRFWSRARRDEWAGAAELSTVPLIATSTFAVPALRKLLGPSRLGSTAAEGVYLRWDDGDWLVARAKVVRAGWVMASDEHWASGPLKTNRLGAPDAHAAFHWCDPRSYPDEAPAKAKAERGRGRPLRT